MTRNIQVIDFTLGKRDSATSVDTSLPFSKNFGETRTIQQANVVIAAYTNANYLDNFGIRTDVDLLKTNIDSVNETLITLAENITTNNEEISTINGLITTINSTLVTLAENIATNTEDIATLTNGLRDLSEDLTSLETALNSLTSRVTNSEEHITTIETNGIIGTTQYGGTLVNDLNDIIKSGFYTCYTGAAGLNAEMLALAVSWYILHQNSNVGTGGAYQRCIAYIAGETVIYERIKIASVWGDFTLKPKRSEIINLQNGWNSAGETWTYSSIDDPTGVITISGDKTTKYSLGMRIKFTNGGNTIYGIITKISYSSPNTTLTFLHEINPTNSLALHLMVNSAITLNYYSNMKVPFGFPSEIVKWQILITSDSTIREQINPTANTWYNLGSYSIPIPIGNWIVGYSSVQQIAVASAFSSYYCGLAMLNDGASLLNFYNIFRGTVTTAAEYEARMEAIYNTTAKTSLYFNSMTKTSNINNIYNRNDEKPLKIWARCTYL